MKTDVIYDNRWISVEDLSRYISVSKETIYKWLEKNQVPAHKIGKLWRFETQEIDEWIRSGDAGKILSSNKEVRGHL